MDKKSLRALGIGFFISGIIVAGYAFFGDEGTNANQNEVEELESRIAYLEEQNARLEVEQAVYEEELENDNSEEDTYEEENPDNEEDNDDNEETNEEENSDENDDENENGDEEAEADEDEDDEEEVITATVTVSEGQPSSVATQLIEEAGIIDDAYELDVYLDDNDMAVLVRPGTYEVTSEMDFAEIADVLTSP